MSLMDDWLAYVGDPSQFDSFHFEALLLEVDTEAKVEKAFAPLPGGAELAKRLNAFRSAAEFNGTYLLPGQRKRGEPEQLAARYRDGVSDRLRDMGRGEEARLVDAAPIGSLPAEAFEEERGAGNLRLLEVLKEIENDFFDEMDAQPGWIDGLYEALYAATNFPVITRYLIQPVMKYPLDESAYAEIWLGGDRVEFCETMTCVVAGGAG